ncbi:MAG: cyanophycin synthetase [Balneolaceae bacterium]
MNILNIKVTCGPNYWSVTKHRLVVMQLDLERLETEPTDEINGFYQQIKEVFPGLYDHQCSEGVPGGFFSRVERGTWMGHVIEHIALELQILAGYDVGFGRTRGTGIKGHYNVVFECTDEGSGKLIAKKAVAIAQDLIDGSPIDVKKHVQEIRAINLKNMPGPSTSSILQEAKTRNIPVIRLEDKSTWQLGYGKHQKRIAATITSNTSLMAVEIADNKKACREFLREMSIPIAKGDVVYSISELKEYVEKIGFPLVAKPVDGNQGRGVTTNIKSYEAALNAFHLASEYSKGVIIERHMPGNDYRLLVINHKVVAVAKRTPAHIKGDGLSTIQQLIDVVNQDECRGDCHDSALTKIRIGTTAKSILDQKGYTLDSVLMKGEVLYLDHAANLSKGGTAEDITDQVHPKVIKMAERISHGIGLDICGIDVIAPTLDQPMETTRGVVLEVNAAPGFRMHLSPSKGESRNVAVPVLDMLYPPKAESRIPIIAVTGTNGKTTTTRLISHILQQQGGQIGYTTTDGIYVNENLIQKGDCGGPQSAQTILKDPTVDMAVLECARGGILRSGLGFDQCDVGVVTNVSSDHLGLDSIHTIEQMARLKSVVPDSVHSSGYAVLNADDNRVFAMRKNLNCNIVLFSMDADDPNLMRHRESGGICVVYAKQHITVWDGKITHTIENIQNIPLSFGGQAGFMIENILAAVAAAYTQDVSPEDIRKALNSFHPSPEKTPGRMNLFRFENYDVLVDYCHNPAGMKAIKDYIASTTYLTKIGIVCGIGDRRDEDNFEIGRLSAELFDKVIIREDANLRGKAPGEATEVVKRGIDISPYNPPVVSIHNEKQSLLFAMENAHPDTLIMLCVENVDEIISLLKQQPKDSKNSMVLQQVVTE